MFVSVFTPSLRISRRRRRFDRTCVCFRQGLISSPLEWLRCQWGSKVLVSSLCPSMKCTCRMRASRSCRSILLFRDLSRDSRAVLTAWVHQHWSKWSTVLHCTRGRNSWRSILLFLTSCLYCFGTPPPWNVPSIWMLFCLSLLHPTLPFPLPHQSRTLLSYYASE